MIAVWGGRFPSGAGELPPGYLWEFTRIRPQGPCGPPPFISHPHQGVWLTPRPRTVDQILMTQKCINDIMHTCYEWQKAIQFNSITWLHKPLFYYFLNAVILVYLTIYFSSRFYFLWTFRQPRGYVILVEWSPISLQFHMPFLYIKIKSRLPKPNLDWSNNGWRWW